MAAFFPRLTAADPPRFLFSPEFRDRMAWQETMFLSVRLSNLAEWQGGRQPREEQLRLANARPGTAPPSLAVCAACFCDQAQSNLHPVTSEDQFHCTKLYSKGLSSLLNLAGSVTYREEAEACFVWKLIKSSSGIICF